MNTLQAASPELKRQVYGRILAAPIFLGLLFFWPAGTLRYWQAWVYMAILMVPMIGIIQYFIKNDPGLLERRLRYREKETKQQKLASLFVLYFLAVFILPGLDQRYGWSNTPVWAVLAADVIVLLAYLLIFQVFRVNSYASRIVEVHENQEVITTGPYSIVRHPMYSAVLVFYMFSPLALGSFWGMLPTILLPILLAARIRNEEDVLARELKGYPEYQQKTRFRMIPGLW